MTTARLATVIATGVLALANCKLAAQPLTLEPAELDRLGVEFAHPTTAMGDANVALPARVTVPPTALSAVSAAFDAKIERLWKATGETVSTGEPLVRLHGPELIKLQGEFLQHSAALALQRSAFTRDKALANAGAIPARRLEETTAALHEARVRLAATRAQLYALGVTQQQIKTLANSERIQDSLVLLAPHDGYVLDKFAEVGQRVEAMTLIYRLARTDELWLEARVPAERAVELSRSQQMTVSDSAELAEIVYIGYGVDTTDNTVTVRAKFANPPRTLRPGQFVLAHWQGNAAPSVELPSTALVHDAGLDYVFVDSAVGIEARRVGVVSRSSQQVRINNGLRASDRVVTSGAAGLKALWLSTREGD